MTEAPMLKTRIYWKCPYCERDDGRTIWMEEWDHREIMDCPDCGKSYVLRYSIVPVVKPPQKIEGEYAPLEENEMGRAYENMREQEKKENK